MTCHTVSVDGTNLHVVDEGSGPALLLGHGYLFDHTMYDGQVAQLAVDHRVVRVDWRAHGASGMPPGSWTMREQGHDYVRVMDALAIERAVVIGQSMGGMAALHLAIDHPVRVRGLVLIDTSAAKEALHRRIKYAGLVTLVTLFGMRRWILREAAAVSFSPSFRRSRPDVVRRWMDRWATLDALYLRRTVTVPVNRPSVVHRLGQIVVPTLVIWGTSDKTTPGKDSRQLARGIPNARLEMLPDTGHMSPIERPLEVARLIREFLHTIGW